MRFTSRWTAPSLALASFILYLASLIAAAQHHGCLIPIEATILPVACLILWMLSVGVGLMRRQAAVVVTILGFTGLLMLLPPPMPHHQVPPESAAVANLRTINTAEVTYLSSSGGRYGNIPELITAGLLDSRYTTSLSGYSFAVYASPGGYTATATPTSPTIGRYGYFSLPDAVIRYQTQVTATCTPCFPAGQSGAPVQ
jgi:hypothetical protein